MIYGYARTSTKEQNSERQRVALQEEDCEELFVDQCSGKNVERPQLQLMMSKLRAGDTVVVKSVDRLARNTKDGFVNGMVASHLLCHSGTINRHSLNG
ncbi:recombinase family protein, partial [Klebsiella pneumoniae]|nr:recombinase family protein [Klebsiella pneumoniae]